MKKDLGIKVKKHIETLLLSGNLENVFSFLRSFLTEYDSGAVVICHQI